METYAVRTGCSQRLWVDITEKAHEEPHFMPKDRALAIAKEVGGNIEGYEVASLTAADALAAKANGAILAMSAAQTYIEENRGGLSNDTTRRLQMAIDVLDAALREYREAAR